MRMMPTDFGAKSAQVQRAAQARFILIARAEAMVIRHAAGSPSASALVQAPVTLVAPTVRGEPSMPPVVVWGLNSRNLHGGSPQEARARGRSGRLPISPALGTLPDRASLVSSGEIELHERHVAGGQLLAFLPSFMHHLTAGFGLDEFDRLGGRAAVVLRRKFASFSPGSVSGCRRAVGRLLDWIRANGFELGCVVDEPPWLRVSDGMMSLWVEDERSSSRGGAQGGASMPSSLKAGVAWGAAHAGLSGLNVTGDAFAASAAPSSAVARQAISLTVRVVVHLRWLQRHHSSPVIRFYAAAVELVAVGALRMRDAQRAKVAYTEQLEGRLLGKLTGLCYTSKHPKRRSAKPRSFSLPKRVGADGDDYIGVIIEHRAEHGGGEWDYLFPRTRAPRKAGFGAEGTAFLAGPAPSAEVIRRMRSLLGLQPLGLTAAAAAKFSGHSGRHFLLCLAKALAASFPGRYTTDELALIGGWQEGMVALYSSEVADSAALLLRVRLLDDLDKIIDAAAKGGAELPAAGGWEQLAGLMGGESALVSSQPADVGAIGAEASSSDSEPDADE